LLHARVRRVVDPGHRRRRDSLRHCIHPARSRDESASFTNQESQMTRNEGSIDRVARAVAGIALIGATVAGLIGPWGWIGVLPLATAAMGWCPLYSVLGLSTCPMKN
jgi:hypothetical protein